MGTTTIHFARRSFHFLASATLEHGDKNWSGTLRTTHAGLHREHNHRPHSLAHSHVPNHQTWETAQYSLRTWMWTPFWLYSSECLCRPVFWPACLCHFKFIRLCQSFASSSGRQALCFWAEGHRSPVREIHAGRSCCYIAENFICMPSVLLAHVFNLQISTVSCNSCECRVEECWRRERCSMRRGVVVQKQSLSGHAWGVPRLHTEICTRRHCWFDCWYQACMLMPSWYHPGTILVASSLVPRAFWILLTVSSLTTSEVHTWPDRGLHSEGVFFAV